MPRKAAAAKRPDPTPNEEEPLAVEVGIRAPHWCMYWRDTGDHQFTEHWKLGLVCKGCGAQPPKKTKEKK